MSRNELYHHGILGQRWGIRRYQNKDGTLTIAGRQRYAEYQSRANAADRVHENYIRSRKALSTYEDNVYSNDQAVQNYRKRMEEIKALQNDLLYNHDSDWENGAKSIELSSKLLELSNKYDDLYYKRSDRMVEVYQKFLKDDPEYNRLLTEFKGYEYLGVLLVGEENQFYDSLHLNNKDRQKIGQTFFDMYKNEHITTGK